MAKLNTPRESIKTHGGATAQHINTELQLKRSVMSCMLWEGEFYEDGQSIADRIIDLIPQVAPDKVNAMVIETREDMNLRHVPLLMVRTMAQYDSHKHLVKDLLIRIIQRPDELAEFLAIYWRKGRQPLSAQVKKGLAGAFIKFDEYQIAKYNRDGAIKLRDVLFLCHAKPKDREQEAMWKRLIDNNLKTPDTWETSLSKDDNVSKVDKWERLLKENKMGAMALLRNLRNMTEANVDKSLVINGLDNMNASRVLPFRFIAAAKYAPRFEVNIEKAMLKSMEQQEKLPGKTILIVDVSGSMYGTRVSGKSEMDRAHTACSLAVVIRELCEDPVIYATAGNDYQRTHKTQLVPSRRGFALSDAIYNLCRPLGGGGIFLKQVMDYVYTQEKTADRIIVITDEQDCDVNGTPAKANAFGTMNYLINIASNRNGIGYGKWLHIDGWSDQVIKYMQCFESDGLQ